MTHKILILGLGNDILTDDAIGIFIVRELKSYFTQENIDIKEAFTTGIDLLDIITNYDKLIIIDAIKTNQTLIGTIFNLKLNELKKFNNLSLHYLGLPEVIELGNLLGFKIPKSINILAIEVKDIFTVSDSFSQELQHLLPDIINNIKTIVKDIINET